MDKNEVVIKLHDCRRYLEDKEWSDSIAGQYIEVLNNAIAILKEQEAVKPKCKERMGGFVAGLCPTCGTALNNVLNVKACGKCGQAVKWE